MYDYPINPNHANRPAGRTVPSSGFASVHPFASPPLRHRLLHLLALLLVACPYLLLPTPSVSAKGDPNCYHRPLADFLTAQGGDSTFFPPVDDMLGWTDSDFTTFALIDYAGLANAYIESQTGSSLGTTTAGRILACPQEDGTVQISVFLQTHKALGFAQSVPAIIENDFDFAGTPTIFGNKAVDVADGATAAVGTAGLRLSFVIAEAGAPLPELIALTNEPEPYAPVTLEFYATTVGPLTDGTPSRLRVQQVGESQVDEEGNMVMVYSREVVDLSRE